MLITSERSRRSSAANLHEVVAARLALPWSYSEEDARSCRAAAAAHVTQALPWGVALDRETGGDRVDGEWRPSAGWFRGSPLAVEAEEGGRGRRPLARECLAAISSPESETLSG